MEVKVQIPFQELLTVVKTLTETQKAKLRQELADLPQKTVSTQQSDFTKLLLNGPVFTEKQIKTIEENRKSITKWRTKN